jgi:very-short-patch-repair endonuclease
MMVEVLVGVAAVAAVVIAWILIQLRKRPDEEKKWPYRLAREGRLMSEAEWFVYERLKQSLDKCHVFCQVSMGQLLDVLPADRKVKEGGTNWRAKIDKKALDFVVCLPEGKVVAVVELDDSSHAKPERKRADEDKDKALDSAGVRVVRWTMKTIPKNDQEIKKLVLEGPDKPDPNKMVGGAVAEALPRLA